jgi:hypothetical protein
MDVNLETLEHAFVYHKPKPDQPARFGAISEATMAAAKAVLLNAPASRERSLALTALQEARMWANAAIALNENSPAVDPKTGA